jgi:hypothetical protein
MITVSYINEQEKNILTESQFYAANKYCKLYIHQNDEGNYLHRFVIITHVLDIIYIQTIHHNISIQDAVTEHMLDLGDVGLNKLSNYYFGLANNIALTHADDPNQLKNIVTEFVDWYKEILFNTDSYKQYINDNDSSLQMYRESLMIPY